MIPVRNEEKFIENTINLVTGQDYPSDKIEILVAYGKSEDRTHEILSRMAARDSRIRILDNPTQRSSGGRNVGARNATGDIITFIDGHTYIDNNQLFKNIVNLMTEKNVSVLSRPQFLDTPDNSFFQKAVSLVRKSAIGHGPGSTIYTKNDMYVDPSSSGATYKREVFEKIGYFDEHFDACEDVDFNYRAAQAGYNSYTSMKLAVYYYPRENFVKLFRQLKRYGVGRFRLARKFPATLSLGTLVPLFITIGFPLLFALSFAVSFFFYSFAFLFGLYLLLIVAWSLGISVKEGPGFLPVLPLVCITVHTGLGWGFFSEMVRIIAHMKENALDKR